jgi:acyl carrier protein
MATGNLLSNLSKAIGLDRRGTEATTASLSEETIRQWLVERVAKQLKVPAATIDSAASFETHGLDSRAAIQLSGQLEKLVELRLSPALLFEQPSIDALSAFLAKQLLEARSGTSGDASVVESAQATT